ncbi:unnamed protein product [Porites evermanni]|uniref:Uncharacterized protein n=1 Tax=Porites evermanni TaxID=104178 RepID=A0ABN8S3Z6_9CNID|nr:unnamed protein product [Porites evermanni]
MSSSNRNSYWWFNTKPRCSRSCKWCWSCRGGNWKEKKKRKIEMSRIALTTYEKVLVEMRAALRGDEWDKEEFVNRMKLVDEMIIDQTPIADRFASRYNKKFNLSIK